MTEALSSPVGLLGHCGDVEGGPDLAREEAGCKGVRRHPVKQLREPAENRTVPQTGRQASSTGHLMFVQRNGEHS